MTRRSQLQMFYDEQRKIGEVNRHFMEMITDPDNPLTNKDLAALIERFPQWWGRFEGYLGKLKD